MTEEEKNGALGLTPDVDQFYAVLKGYVEFCIQKPKTKLTDKEKEGLEQKDISAKESQLKEAVNKHEEQKKLYQKKFETLCEQISKNGFTYLSEYVNTLYHLNKDKPDWKRDIKSLLVHRKSLMLFKEARTSIAELYPILKFVNGIFSIDDYSELSLSPKAAMYGSEIDKTQKDSTKRPPMNNEEYQAMLEMFRQVKDEKRFGEWLTAILMFTPDRMVDGFQETFVQERKKLKQWLYTQINSNNDYKRAIEDLLFSHQLLNTLIDAFAEKTELKKKQTALEEENKKLQEKNTQEKAQHDEQRANQYQIILNYESEIDDLKHKVREYNRCSQELDGYIEKYKAQIGINERITIENVRRLNEAKTVLESTQCKLKETMAQLEELQTAYTALQSDYSLTKNELQRLKEAATQKEEAVRKDVMRELVSGISEQLYYLTMFYLELKDTGMLSPESIDLFADTLNNIDGVLKKLGINKIGVIEQTTYYDASIHSSTDSKLSNGDKVVVSGFGWKIHDEVYIKAPVEKEENGNG